MKKQRVVIVNEGAWGEVTKESYDSFVRFIKREIERAMRRYPSSGEEKKRAESVIVVESTDEAIKRLDMNDVDILIFNSRGMIPEAREIKRKYRRLKVILLTGLIPDDEIILMDKGWIASLGSSVLKTIVFD